jgi:hypothetical protein
VSSREGCFWRLLVTRGLNFWLSERGATVAAIVSILFLPGI